MYVAYPHSRVARPAQELRGFKRVTLQPGETKTVKMTLSAHDLAYFDTVSGHFVVEREPVTVRIGSSSADIRLEHTLNVTP
jgi:beta-glucosidase